MATSPLKITVNPALPKNEIDLICMLLAGRLRDLWNGKLFCAELSINDLIKETAGIDALGGLRDALGELKGGLDAFKSASGYDAILSKVNQTLAGVGNIFSLGGLCPSPITAPQIPDVLGQLNQNLFGQAGNILNALVQASTPQMCFGGGPGGFGVNWSNMSGNLKNLKNAIDAFKNDPAGMNRTMRAFEANIKSQTRRLNSELDRLKKNLTDPLGIGDKQNTARKIQRTNALSADYKVKDKRGIEHSGVLSPMITADVNAVLNRTDKLSTTPVTYKIEPMLDYCGEVVGYKKVGVTGDPNYIGWTTDPTYNDLNQDNPTVNPTATYIDYDFLFTDDAQNIKVQDKTGAYINDIVLNRGKSYRIGFKLYHNHTVKFYNQTSIWTSGIKYGSDPVYGIGADGAGQIIIDEASPYKPDYKVGEAYWDVLIENPTTPNTLTWNGNNGQSGNIIIDGPTEIPLADRSYDISMAFKKGLMHYKKAVVDGIPFEKINTTGRYSVRLNLRLSNGTTYTVNNNVLNFANNITTADSYVVYKNIDYVDYVQGNKIVKYITRLPDGKYLVEKMYLSDKGGLKMQEINFYITGNLSDESQSFAPIFNIKFDKELTFMNDTRLPYSEEYSYYWSAPLGDAMDGIKDYNLYDNDEHTFEINNDNLSLWLTSNRSVNDVNINEFIWRSTVKVDTTDLSREYVDTDPYMQSRRIYVQGLDGALMDYEITYNDSSNPDTALSSSNSPISIVDYARLESPVSYNTTTVSGGVQPYEYKLISRSGSGTAGLEFDKQTGRLAGIPSAVLAPSEYDVEVTDLLGDEPMRTSFSMEIKEAAIMQPTKKYATLEEVDTKIDNKVSAIESRISTAIASAIAAYSGASSGGGGGGSGGGGSGGDGTVIGPGPGLPELPAQLLDPTNEFFSTADGYFWGPDSERGGLERWQFVPPPIETINAATGQVWRANWDRETNTWIYPPRPW